MNKYENSQNELKSILTENVIQTNLTEDQIEIASKLEDILESETLFIEDKESGSALVLENKVNGKIFEAVAVSSYGLLNSILDEALISEEDENEEDKEEDKKKEKEDEEDSEGEEPSDESTETDESYIPENDEEDKNEDKDEDKEDKDEDKEDKEEEDFEDEKEKKATEEALMNLIYATEYIIKTDLEKPGFVINENSPYFESIRQSLIERLVDISETDEEMEISESIVKEYSTLFTEDTGYGLEVNEADKVPMKQKAKNAKDMLIKRAKNTREMISKKAKQAKELVKANPKKSIALASIPVAAGAAYGASKLYKHMKNKKAEKKESLTKISAKSLVENKLEEISASGIAKGLKSFYTKIDPKKTKQAINLAKRTGKSAEEIAKIKPIRKIAKSRVLGTAAAGVLGTKYLKNRIKDIRKGIKEK